MTGYKNSDRDNLALKLPGIAGLLFVLIVWPFSREGIPVLVFFLFFLAMCLPFLWFSCQVELTIEEVRYRRFRVWKSLPWRKIEAVRCHRMRPPDTIILRLKGEPFYKNQIWFRCGSQLLSCKDLSDSVPFKFAAEAIARARGESVAEPSQAPSELAAQTAEAKRRYFIVVIYWLIVSLAPVLGADFFGLPVHYHRFRTANPDSSVVRAVETLLQWQVYFPVLFLSALLPYISSKLMGKKVRGWTSIVFLCISLTPIGLLLGLPKALGVRSLIP